MVRIWGLEVLPESARPSGGHAGALGAGLAGERGHGVVVGREEGDLPAQEALEDRDGEQQDVEGEGQREAASDLEPEAARPHERRDNLVHVTGDRGWSRGIEGDDGENFVL